MTEPGYRLSLEAAFRDFLETCVAWGAAESVPTATGGGPRDLRNPVRDQDYRPVLTALLETVLPFGHADFPLTREAVLSRLLARIGRKGEWADALGNALSLFDDAAAFSRAREAAQAQERLALEGYPINTPEKVIKHLDQKRGHDEKLLAFFRKKHGLQGISNLSFGNLDPETRKDYFWLWSQSGFTLKRRFHRTSRAAITAAAYSCDSCLPPEAGSGGF